MAAEEVTGVRERLRRLLAALEPRIVTSGFAREAAVLLALFESAREPHLLLTRRTEEVRTHKGQISFPGGMRLGGESLEATALRETYEEIGVAATSVDLLGRYHDYLSSTGFRVVPFAGWIDGPVATIAQAREVAEVLEVPLGIFRDPGRIRFETILREGRRLEVPFVRFGAHEIWGLTARVVLDVVRDLDT
jgi:8-oxo-dGTP pyrophosphatase MutT (NUDIX family)